MASLSLTRLTGTAALQYNALLLSFGKQTKRLREYPEALSILIYDKNRKKAHLKRVNEAKRYAQLLALKRFEYYYLLDMNFAEESSMATESILKVFPSE